MSRFSAAEQFIESSTAIGSYERLAKVSDRMMEDVTALIQGGSARPVAAPDIVRTWDQIRRVEPLAAPEISMGYAGLTKAARQNGRLTFGAETGLRRIEMPEDWAPEHRMDLKLTAAHMRLLTEDMSAAGFNLKNLSATAPEEQTRDFLRGATRGAYSFSIGDKAGWNSTSQYLYNHYGPFVSTNPAHLTRLVEFQVLDTSVKLI